MNIPGMTDEERQDAIEHYNAVLAMKRLMIIPEGKTVFKFFFKQFQVAKIPPRGTVPDEDFKEMVGMMRAGQAVFELASEADAQTAGYLLAQLEEERYEIARAAIIRELEFEKQRNNRE